MKDKAKQLIFLQAKEAILADRGQNDQQDLTEALAALDAMCDMAEELGILTYDETKEIRQQASEAMNE